MDKIVELAYQATLEDTGVDGKRKVAFVCEKSGEYELECGRCPLKGGDCRNTKYDRAGWEKWKEEQDQGGSKLEDTKAPVPAADISPEEEKKEQIHEFMGVLKTFWTRCCPHKPFSRMLSYADRVAANGFKEPLRNQGDKLMREWNKTQIVSLSKEELDRMDHILEKMEGYWVEKVLDWNFGKFCLAYKSILPEVGVVYDDTYLDCANEKDPDADPFTSLTDEQCEQILDYVFTGENKPFFA